MLLKHIKFHVFNGSSFLRFSIDRVINSKRVDLLELREKACKRR